jgi:hypothetical protein
VTGKTFLGKDKCWVCEDNFLSHTSWANYFCFAFIDSFEISELLRELFWVTELSNLLVVLTLIGKIQREKGFQQTITAQVQCIH